MLNISLLLLMLLGLLYSGERKKFNEGLNNNYAFEICLADKDGVEGFI